MADEVKDVKSAGDSDVGDKVAATEKSYSQAEVDALVSKSVEPFRRSHEQYGELSKSPRFQNFVEEENRRIILGDDYDKIYGGKPTQDKPAEPDLENMSEAERIDYLVEQKVNARLAPVEERNATRDMAEMQRNVQEELKSLDDKDKYPMYNEKIGETPVKELMAKELERAMQRGHNITYDQAYRLATYEYQRELGRKDSEAILAKKREAAMIGIPPSSPGSKNAGSPRKFKNAREAAEAALDELGL